MKRILFLCEHNDYPSRFAEAYFRLRAAKYGLSWTVDSRGLETSSPSTLPRATADDLAQQGISVDLDHSPRLVTLTDLETATQVVAIDQERLAPHLQARFADWADGVTYWPLADRTSVERTLAALTAELEGLLAALIPPDAFRYATMDVNPTSLRYVDPRRRPVKSPPAP